MQQRQGIQAVKLQNQFNSSDSLKCKKTFKN